VAAQTNSHQQPNKLRLKILSDKEGTYIEGDGKE
jgi:hypothetical protein